MNILFFLLPKNKIAFVKSNASLRQAIEKIEESGYTSIPVINNEGEFVETLTVYDILHYFKEKEIFSIYDAEKTPLMDVKVKREVKAIKIDQNIESLLDLAAEQNFVPVVDDENHFIGIIKRSSIINYFRNHNIEE